MFEIEFYKNRQGNEPVKEYIKNLRKRSKTSKESRIRFNKIVAYLDKLSEYGTRMGAPFVKQIEGEIWELRPNDDRIFFFYWSNNTFILLHHFVKKTQKTPKREIDQAKRNLQDYLERSDIK